MAIGKNLGANSQSSNDFLEPLAPTGVSGSNVGTSRAFNDGAVTVSFSLPANSPAATSYEVTASSGETATGASSPVTVTGLDSSSNPTFTVVAINAVGASSASAASAAVTVTTVPATPSAPSVSSPTPSAGANQAGTTTDDVSWTAPSAGGATITGYTWTSSDGKTGTTAGTSVSVAQEGGTAQTYQVRAENSNGSGSYSTNSGSVTTFSFTPFSFVPFGAFGFVPFSFVPFAFTPFSFVPFNAFSFTPFNFAPFSFTPFNFSPTGRSQ
jgi:hypothetical protein